MDLEHESTLLVNEKYLLQKQTGKGGWTYAYIHNVKNEKHSGFGLKKVSGSIDGYEISNVHLMPMGKGQLILPVNAAIRKQIGKQEGDWVQIILFTQGLPPVIVDDFILCLKEDVFAFETYNKLSKNEQDVIIEWIYSAKNDATKIERIATTLNRLTT